MTEIINSPSSQDEQALRVGDTLRAVTDESYEQITWPTLAELYRPLDTQDFEWMLLVGADIPEDEVTRLAWLETVNGFVVAGSEKQPSHSDDYSKIVYDARRCFNNTFPLIKEVASRVVDYTFTGSAYSSRASVPPIPSGNIVSNLRLYHDALQWDIKSLISTYPLLLITPASTAIERIGNVARKGIPIQDVQKNIGIITTGTDTINDRHRTLRSMARAWDMDDHPQICRSGNMLTLSQSKIRTIGRLLTELFKDTEPDSIERKYVNNILFLRPEMAISAYLRRRGAISSFVGLRYQAYCLDGYPTEHLRGYILTQHRQDPDDPVTKAYFKNYPLQEGEAETLPEVSDLPTLLRGRKSLQPDTQIDGLEAHTTRVTAIDMPHFIRSLQSVKKPLLDIQTQLFQSVTQSLRNEQNQGDYYPDWNADLKRGREARKQLVMIYAQDALSHMKGTDADSEDKVQDRLLGLLIAINEFAQNNDHPQPETFLSYFESFMKSSELRKILAGMEDEL